VFETGNTGVAVSTACSQSRIPGFKALLWDLLRFITNFVNVRKQTRDL